MSDVVVEKEIIEETKVGSASKHELLNKNAFQKAKIRILKKYKHVFDELAK